MNLTAIRDRLFTFILPVIIVGAVLGYVIWLFGTRFFWDASSLTVQAPTGDSVMARIEVQSNIIDYDLPIPGLLHYTISLLMGREVGETYPLHFTLPWSQTVACSETCEFGRIPAGEALLSLAGTSGNTDNSQIQIMIAPDTRGTVNLRPAVEIADIPLDTYPSPDLSDTEKNLIDGSVVAENRSQGLFVFRGPAGEILYDKNSRQAIKLPNEIDTVQLMRGKIDGVYIIFDGEDVYQFDRFGRKALQKIETYTAGGISLKWIPGKTEVTVEKGQSTLAGWWWMMPKDEKTYISNGSRVIEFR